MGKRRTVTTLLLVSSSLVGCAAGTNDNSGDGSTSVAKQTADFNPADVMFAQMMIPHHEQAIEMSDIALDPNTGAGSEVRDLASRIRAAQDPEIVLMTDMLESWNMSLTMDPSMDHGEMMSGMLTVDELEQLGTLRGPEFDKKWIESMIAHHEGAVQMANDVVADGKNAGLRELADKIIAGQTAEISQMRGFVG